MKFFKSKKGNVAIKAGEQLGDGTAKECECEAVDHKHHASCKELVRQEADAVLSKATTVMDSLTHGRLRVKLARPK